MKIIAEQKNTRQSVRKVRLVADAIRHLPLTQAVRQLSIMDKKASGVMIKTLRQAIANAQHNFGVPVSSLEIDSIIVNDGPQYKRFRAVSRGRAHTILKRSCHVKVILKSTEAVSPVVKPAQKSTPSEVQESTTQSGVNTKEETFEKTAQPNRAVAPKKEKATGTAKHTTRVMNRTTSK